MKSPNYNTVREFFDYRKDGNLIWKIPRTNGVKVGDVAGNLCTSIGYMVIGIKGIQYLLHRVIFLWHHGFTPENDIDHKDRNPLNNRIDNLRESTEVCNSRNSKVYKNSTSGVTGVSWDCRTNKWFSYITVNRAQIQLGRYENFDDAVKSRYLKEIELNWRGCNSTSSSYLYLKEKGVI